MNEIPTILQHKRNGTFQEYETEMIDKSTPEVKRCEFGHIMHYMGSVLGFTCIKCEKIQADCCHDEFEEIDEEEE
jgi:hypothetical protein